MNPPGRRRIHDRRQSLVIGEGRRGDDAAQDLQRDAFTDANIDTAVEAGQNKRGSS